MSTKATPGPHSSITVPYRSLVRRADPDFDKANRHQLEYEFSNGKKFFGDPAKRGANNPADQVKPPGNAPGQVVSGPNIVPTAPPIANPDAVTTPFQTPITIFPLANDTDPGGFALTLVSVTAGTSGPTGDSTAARADSALIKADASAGSGTATVIGNTVVFTPASGFSGVSVLSYTIFNGVFAATGTISVTVLSLGIPLAPTGFAATPNSTTQITLSISSGDTATSFKVERRSPAGSGTFTQIAAGVSMPYADTGLSPNTQYEYRVRGTNASGDGPYSGSVSATTLLVAPNAPTGVAATTVSSSRIDISISNGDTATSFKVERRSPAGSGTFVQIATGVAMPYADTGLSAFTQYEYRIRGTNSAGDSAYSSAANATTYANPPLAPTGLLATTVNSTQISLSISNGDTATSFKVERRSPAGSGSFVQIAAGVSMPYTDTGLSPLTQYEYRVRGTNGFGDSGYSSSSNATTNGVAPNAPTGFAAIAISSTQIDLSISNGSTATSFKIERRSPAGSGSFVEIAAGVSMPYSNTSLSPNTQYEYRVRGTNSWGDSAYSSNANATTPTGGSPGASLMDELGNVLTDELGNALLEG